MTHPLVADDRRHRKLDDRERELLGVQEAHRSRAAAEEEKQRRLVAEWSEKADAADLGGKPRPSAPDFEPVDVLPAILRLDEELGKIRDERWQLYADLVREGKGTELLIRERELLASLGDIPPNDWDSLLREYESLRKTAEDLARGWDRHHPGVSATRPRPRLLDRIRTKAIPDVEVFEAVRAGGQQSLIGLDQGLNPQPAPHPSGERRIETLRPDHVRELLRLDTTGEI